MKSISFFFCSLFLIATSSYAQDEIIDLVEQGVELHNAGQYDEAIAIYSKALKKEKKSPLVNYELGLTYFVSKDYKKAIKHFDVVIKQDKEYVNQAYVAQGSAYDNMGKAKEAIKVYEKAIKKFPDDYLLHYNLALTLYRKGETAKAAESAINAVATNPMHGSSHYLLGLAKAEEGRRVESLMSLYFFLLIEPNSGRSKEALAIVHNLFNQGVDKKDDKNVEITLDMLGANDDFSAMDMMISMMSASNTMEENKDKTSQELFYENNKVLFSLMEENAKSKTGIWWELYADFYLRVMDSGNLEAFCYYITQANGDVEKQWLKDNEEKMDTFSKWLTEK